jgi:hypothetical protein
MVFNATLISVRWLQISGRDSSGLVSESSFPMSRTLASAAPCLLFENFSTIPLAPSTKVL